jgi:two-component system response regulator YesN
MEVLLMNKNELINSLLIKLFEILIDSFSKQLSLVCLHDVERYIENLNKTAYTRDELLGIVSDAVNKVLSSVHSTENESSSFTKVLDYIHANYNKDLSLSELSEMFGVASQYFSKVFKDNMGTTLVLYLTDLRLNKALELLENTDKLGKDIAAEVGYSNPQYFIRVFKKKYRCSPSKFRRQGVNDEEME